MIRRPEKLNGTLLNEFIKNKKDWPPADYIQNLLLQTDLIQHCFMRKTPSLNVKPDTFVKQLTNYKVFNSIERKCKQWFEMS